MITYLQAIILGLLQGVSELFPISSLGHSVILPQLLGWHINQKADFFLVFLIATHFATALVLFVFYWKEWVQILLGLIRSLKEREIKQDDTYAKLAWLLVIGTIPAGILGVLFQDALQSFFASAQQTAFFLLVNGFVLLAAEILKRKRKTEQSDEKETRIAKFSYKKAAGVGLAQAVALIPGFSRTGAALSGGLLMGLSHSDAARFAFLLATPIIGAAAVLKLPDLVSADGNVALGPTLVGALSAAIAAFFAVKFLTKYFKTNTLLPFGIYCILAGGLSWIVLLFR